jgi:hypothetical protein
MPQFLKCAVFAAMLLAPFSAGAAQDEPPVPAAEAQEEKNSFRVPASSVSGDEIPAYRYELKLEKPGASYGTGERS